MKSRRARIVAFYLPQYHVVPENEAWWGEGFTDWVNVKKAQPLFPGHYQPRVPSNGNYYDLGDPKSMAAQIDLAKSFGVEGFCHYHYWFNGRRILETPTDAMLANRGFDFPFCLCWVNASWSRRWKGDGAGNGILVRQRYTASREAWLNHFEILFRAWSDDRHLKVGARPVFLIYNPHEIPDVGRMLDCWRSEAARRGLAGIHVVAMRLFPFLGTAFLRHFDAVALMQPSNAMFVPVQNDPLLSRVSLERFLRALPPVVAEPLRDLRYRQRSRVTTYDYDELWERAVNWTSVQGKPTYPGAFVDWDNTARYGRRARIVRGATPERFGYWFGRLVDSVQARTPDEKFIFVNAWNEWAEGAYLEPDERFGYAYLEALEAAL